MKAERKHELQHNDLDDIAAKSVTFLRENGAIIGGVVGLLAVAAIVYVFVLAPKPINADAGPWKDYFFALSDRNADKELEDFIDKEDKAGRATQPAVLWARLSLGKLKLAEGTRQLFEDRDAAQQSLEEAEKNFLAIEKNAARDAELLDRARLGLAEVYESQDKPEDAQKYYGIVAKSSDPPLAKLGSRGERRMAQKSNQEFLTWFAQQKPVRKPTGLPPGDFKDLPDSPNFSVPPLPGSDDKPITPGFKIPSKLPPESTEPDKAGTDKDPREKKKPAATESPAEEPDDQKPADQKPAEKPE